MRVEVVFAEPQRQRLIALEVSAGATVADVLAIAARQPEFADIELASHDVGIFGKICERSAVVKAADRVEIYRALRVDAKTARRLRAEEQARRSG